MNKKLKSFLVIAMSLVILVACRSTEEVIPVMPASPSEDLTPDQILTLGDVSDDPAGTIESFQPMADYLAASLADAGIRQGKVVIVPSLEIMNNYLESGQVDIYFESPYGALTVYEETGAIPLARRWKKGVSEYYTVVVVRTDSGITDLDGLLGGIVTFEDDSSTSGYLLPKAHLVNLGYSMSEVASVAEAVPDDNVGYIFAGGEENVIAWVLNGKTIASALPIGNYEELSEEDKKQLTILTETVAIPRHIVMVSPTMDEVMQEQLFELLMNMDQTSEGQSALESFEKTARFDLLPYGPAGTMQVLQELFAPVR